MPEPNAIACDERNTVGVSAQKRNVVSLGCSFSCSVRSPSEPTINITGVKEHFFILSMRDNNGSPAVTDHTLFLFPTFVALS